MLAVVAAFVTNAEFSKTKALDTIASDTEV
jgi:hypothetical protein